MSLSSSTYYTSFGMVSTSKFNLEVITLIIAIFTYIFELVTKHLKAKIKTNDLIYQLNLYYQNKKICINAFLDTGNLLQHKDNPVIIIDLKSYLKLTNKNMINFYLDNTSQISTGTVNGNNSLKLYQIDKAEIFKGKQKIKLNNQYIAVSTNNFSDNNYQALLSPLFF